MRTIWSRTSSRHSRPFDEATHTSATEFTVRDIPPLRQWLPAGQGLTTGPSPLDSNPWEQHALTGNGKPEPSRATRWLLWLSLLHTLPAPFFLFVVVGTVPAAGLLAGGVAGLFAGDRQGLAMGAVLGAQGAGYAALYFLVAWLAEFLLRRLRAVPLRSGVLAILVAAMFAASLAPIYGSGGHGAEQWTNLPGLLEGFAAPPVGAWLAPYFGALGVVLAGLLVLLFVIGRDGVDQDLPRGRQWWDRAAALGHVPTLRYVADARVSGTYGYPIDFARARDEFAVLAEAFGSGSHGVEADPGQAQHWRSALRDVERKIADLGTDYRPMDELRERAQAGDPQAQYQLVPYYERGDRFVPRDHARVVELLQQAAAGKHPQAMWTLGLAYEKGRFGLARDLRKAGELYREILTAQAGDPYGWRQEERFYSMVRVRIGAVERMQAMAPAP